MAIPRMRARYVWAGIAALVVGTLAVAAQRLLLPRPLYGSVVAFVGDADGDGTADFAVGETPYGSQCTWTLVSGRSGRELLRMKAGLRGKGMDGVVLSSAGDLDEDGAADVAIAVGEEVRLHSGRTGALIRSLALADFCAMTSENDPTRVMSMCPAGDLDGDRKPDLAFAVENGMEGIQFVAVVSGRDGRLVRRISSESRDEYFGYSLAGGADFNTDGTPDLVVACTTKEWIVGAVGGRVRNGRVREGRIQVISGRDGKTLMSCPGGPGTAWFVHDLRSTVSVLPDRDADGTPELLVANNGLYEQSLRVLSGRTGAKLKEWLPPKVHEDHLTPKFHGSLSDLDGDGLPELAFVHFVAVGDCFFGPAELLVQSSKSGDVLWSCAGEGAGMTCTMVAATGADLDGDGVSDVLVGETGGRGASWSGYVRALSGKDGRVLYTDRGGLR